MLNYLPANIDIYMYLAHALLNKVSPNICGILSSIHQGLLRCCQPIGKPRNPGIEVAIKFVICAGQDS